MSCWSLLKTGLNNVVLTTLFNAVNNTEQIVEPESSLQSGVIWTILLTTLNIRELKIDNAASSKTRCQYISTERSCLEFDCFNNHLKLVLVTYRYFCWPKRYAFCYKLDFQNASYVVACFALLKGRDNSQFDVLLGMATLLRIPLGLQIIHGCCLL